MRAVGLRHARGHPLGHLGGGVADVDLAAGDVVLAAVERGRAGEAGDRVLGRGVGGRVGPRHMGRDRAVVDDPAALRVLALHQAEGVLGAQEDAGQVDVDHGLPLLVGQVLERHGGAPVPALLNSRSSRPNASRDLGEDLADRDRVADVARDRQHPRPGGAGALGRGVELLLAAADHGHRPAGLDQPQRGRAPDPAARPGDQSDPRLVRHVAPPCRAGGTCTLATSLTSRTQALPGPSQPSLTIVRRAISR